MEQHPPSAAGYSACTTQTGSAAQQVAKHLTLAFSFPTASVHVGVARNSIAEGFGGEENAREKRRFRTSEAGSPSSLSRRRHCIGSPANG